jgi:hypothetical protein
LASITSIVVNTLAGNDTLNATFVGFSPTAVPLSLTGIETINLTNFGSGTFTLGALNITGVDVFNSVNSVDDITISGVQETADFGLTGINSPAVDLGLQFALASTTSGFNDAITGTLSGANAGTVNIQTASGTTNGFETLALVSAGSSANTLGSITQTNGTTMATLNISGAQALTLNTIPNTILTVNGATMTGSLQLGTGTSMANYMAFSTANMNSITGGTGDDVFIFGNTLDSNDFDGGGETLNGGTGTDVFQASFAASIGTALRLSSIEELRLNATANAVSINLTNVIGLTTATIEADGSSNSGFALLNISGSPLPTLQFRGTGTQAAQTYDGVLYMATGVTGSNDSLTVMVGNRGTALNASGTTNAHAVGNLQLPNIENVTLNVSDGPGVFNGLGASTLVTLSVTGSSHVTLGQVDALSSTLVQVNAAGVSGNFTATIDDLGSGALVTLGLGNDTFSAGLSSGNGIAISAGSGNDFIMGSAQADIINGGAGNDTLNGGAGADILTGGYGTDTFRFDNSVASGSPALADIVTDWTDGTDFIAISGSNTFGAGAVGFAQGGGAAGSLAVTANGGVTILTVAQNQAAQAVGAGTQFIKLTTGVATGASDQATFNSAIGTATITGLTGGTSMVGSYYNTTTGQAVIIDIDATPTTNTMIETGDTIRVIARIIMSAANYTNFTGADLGVY